MTPSWSTMTQSELKKAITDNARAMNVTELRSLVDAGLFDADKLDHDDRKGMANTLPSSGNSQRFDLWAGRMNDVCSFSRNATLTERSSTLLDMPPKPYAIAVLPATDEFRAWFMDATAVLLDNWPRAMASAGPTGKPGPGVVALTRWMACACMLDLPDAVRKIHDVCPQAHTFTRPLSNLFTKSGEALGFNVKALSLNVSPVWVAWQFSAQKCLDVFAELTEKIKPSALIALKMEKQKFKSMVNFPISLVEAFNESEYRLVCDNETFRRAIVVGLRSSADKDAVERSAQGALTMGSEPGRRAHRIPAYLAEGVYNRRPAESMNSACLSGLVPMFNEIGKAIDPAHFDTNTLYLALSAHQPGKDQRDVAVLKILLLVDEKAGLDAAKDLFWGVHSNNKNQSTPIVHLFDKNCDKVLVALMDAGIVEPTVAWGGRNTAMDIAQGMNSPMAAVMASWVARRTAHSLIAEIGMSPFKAKTNA